MLGNVLTPSKVFTSLTLFNQLRLPLFFFPSTLNALAEAKVGGEHHAAFRFVRD